MEERAGGCLGFCKTNIEDKSRSINSRFQTIATVLKSSLCMAYARQHKNQTFICLNTCVDLTDPTAGHCSKSYLYALCVPTLNSKGS